jgi:hypothetical protein
MNRVTFIVFVCVIAAALGLRAVAQQPGGQAQGGHAHGEAAEGKPATVVGELIDTACFVASGGDAKGPDHAECAKECMGSGVPAAVLPEGAADAGAMMFLLTNPVVLAPHAGKTIKVEGTAHERMRAFDVKRLWVKDGNDWKEVPLKDAHHKMSEGAGHGGHGGHK